jgi:hypothetical protein
MTFFGLFFCGLFFFLQKRISSSQGHYIYLNTQAFMAPSFQAAEITKSVPAASGSAMVVLIFLWSQITTFNIFLCIPPSKSHSVAVFI